VTVALANDQASRAQHFEVLGYGGRGQVLLLCQ
jgi:hypothetical protein